MRRKTLPAHLLVVVLSLGLLTPAAAVVTFCVGVNRCRKLTRTRRTRNPTHVGMNRRFILSAECNSKFAIDT